jgi:hypothetical protein
MSKDNETTGLTFKGMADVALQPSQCMGRSPLETAHSATKEHLGTLA